MLSIDDETEVSGVFAILFEVCVIVCVVFSFCWGGGIVRPAS